MTSPEELGARRARVLTDAEWAANGGVAAVDSHHQIERALSDSNSIPHIEVDRAETNLTASEGLRGLPFTSLSRVLENVPAEPDWVWDGYLAPGALSLLAGVPKVGKSTLVFGLLQALEDSIAHGGSLGAETNSHFLGRSIRPGRVLLLSEERRDLLAEKARRFGVVDSVVDVLMRHEAYDRPWSEIAAAALVHCLENEVGLLVVDTWDKWAQLRGDEENSTGAVLEKVEPLQPFLAAGIAVWLAGHQRKSGGSYGEAVKGSNALIGAVDVVMELERVRGLDPDKRVLRAVSRFASTPEEVVVSLADDRYTVTDRDAAREAADLARLVEALETLGSATAKLLSEETGISGSTVRKRLANAPGVRTTGEGKKGDPHVYSLSADDDIPF